MDYFMIVMVSLTFIGVSLALCMEKKEIIMNCEQCKFAKVIKLGTKPECTKKPPPTPTTDGKCYWFVKQRSK